jgi:hypothetical protein
MNPMTSYRPDSTQDQKLAATSKGENAEALKNQLFPRLPWSMPHQTGAKEEKSWESSPRCERCWTS